MTPAIIAAITGILQLVATVLLPNLNSASTIAKVITLLEQVIPVIVQEAQDLAGPVRNIIAALRSNGAIMPEQLDALDAAEAKLDADFDAAAAAAAAQDASGA